MTALDEAAAALRAGELVAFPTETVYGLGADAFNETAVARIFEVKGRPRSDPLIVHVPSVAAAEALVLLTPRGVALMRDLTAHFWPGPLTLVAPAVPELPAAVTSGSGFVGVRIPQHSIARSLLEHAAVPVAAPSANRFGHVSPTRAHHVMDDLGHHPILVLDAPADECCGVGIESTVVKIDEERQLLVLLRRGGVPEAALARWLAEQASGAGAEFTLEVKPAHQPTPPHQPERQPDAAEAKAADVAAAKGKVAAASSGEAGAEEVMVSPGMLLTHYSPDLPSYLVCGPELLPAAPPDAICAHPHLPLTEAVVLDFGGRLASLQVASWLSLRWRPDPL